jgi:hypothetical protein
MVRLQEVEALNRRKKGPQRACEVRWLLEGKKGTMAKAITFKRKKKE